MNSATLKNAPLLVAALGHAAEVAIHHANSQRDAHRAQVELRTFEMQLDARRDMQELEADAFRTLVHAVVERRIDAVQNGFNQVMTMYAEQARSYSAQHEKLIDGLIKSSDPLERGGLTSRAAEVEMQLRRVRSDALRLYRELNRVILLIGGKPPQIPSTDRSFLQLP